MPRKNFILHEQGLGSVAKEGRIGIDLGTCHAFPGFRREKLEIHNRGRRSGSGGEKSVRIPTRQNSRVIPRVEFQRVDEPTRAAAGRNCDIRDWQPSTSSRRCSIDRRTTAQKPFRPGRDRHCPPAILDTYPLANNRLVCQSPVRANSSPPATDGFASSLNDSEHSANYRGFM